MSLGYSKLEERWEDVFLDTIPKTQSVKEIIAKLDFIKI